MTTTAGGSETGTPALDTWAIVEAMGHRTLIGKLTETTIAGAPMLSVLRMDGRTQLLPPASVYMITPVTREEADAADRRHVWGSGLPVALPASTATADVDDGWDQAGRDSAADESHDPDYDRDLDDDEDDEDDL